MFLVLDLLIVRWQGSRSIICGRAARDVKNWQEEDHEISQGVSMAKAWRGEIRSEKNAGLRKARWTGRGTFRAIANKRKNVQEGRVAYWENDGRFGAISARQKQWRRRHLCTKIGEKFCMNRTDVMKKKDEKTSERAQKDIKMKKKSYKWRI